MPDQPGQSQLPLLPSKHFLPPLHSLPLLLLLHCLGGGEGEEGVEASKRRPDVYYRNRS